MAEEGRLISSFKASLGYLERTQLKKKKKKSLSREVRGRGRPVGVTLS